MVGQVGREVAIGVGQRVLDLPQVLVILLGPLDALLQLLLPQRRLRKSHTHIYIYKVKLQVYLLAYPKHSKCLPS